MFVVNQVSQNLHSKRFLKSHPPVLGLLKQQNIPRVHYRSQESEKRVNQGCTFATQARFSKPSEDSKLPFWHQLADPGSAFTLKKTREKRPHQLSFSLKQQNKTATQWQSSKRSRVSQPSQMNQSSSK